jgi:hypothetical protein
MSSEHSEHMDEILFSDLEQRDSMVMETGRSVYTFTLTDKANRRGILIGGNVTEPREAVFSGSLQQDKAIWENGVRVRARATFFLVVPQDLSGFSQVITSPLVRIRLVRGNNGTASY